MMQIARCVERKDFVKQCKNVNNMLIRRMIRKIHSKGIRLEYKGPAR